MIRPVSLKGEPIMGDRALIIFTDGAEVSPTVYLHWAGASVPDYIDDLATRAHPQGLSADYAAARFIGIAHEDNTGTLSLGVMQTPQEMQAAIQSGKAEAIASFTHGDAGVVVVDVKDFSWQAYGGYLAEDYDDEDEEAA
jgi:hypothetical protein